MSEWIKAEEYCVSVFDGTHDTPKVTETGYKLVTSKNILSNTLDLNSAYYISEEDFANINKRSKVKQYDILFSMIGTVGSLYFETSDTIDYAIKNIGVFSCGNKEKAEWLYYYLQSNYAQQYIKRYLNGAVQKFLPLKGLREFPVLQFNNELHNRIKILLSIDQKIQTNNQINQELEAMVKTLHDYWFVQFDFPDQNGKPYKSSGGKMVYHPELKREIPEGWGVEKLSHFLTIKNGKDHKHLQDGEFAVYGSGGIIRMVTDYLYSGESILFPRKGTLNNVMYVNEKFWTVDTMFYSEVNKNNSALYVFYSVKDIDFNKLNTGTGVPSMTSSILYDLNIIVPEENILEKFNTIVKQNYETIKLNSIQNQELIQLRDWLLPMLMNGQVKVE
ncbi:restriction endonuclease subunit S [Streptococcus taonis]|uniref:Restriction endonuclease subunit S n=1 Tax=Streptococcus taonis TaxID=3041623 RepID=A0ABT6PB39_9STRE|nr:restriction endonuclease subunit S [Streptococcus sp. ST22-14]MDI1473198.1 restriction endonuclease subunit S [Streptococcus sp. ST22-14]